MDPTTIRLPPDTLDELDDEYSDYGYGARSDYIRDIIEHRDPPYPDTSTTTDYDRPTTDDYERLHDRVDDLEAKVDDLEEKLNQQPDPITGDMLVNESGDMQPRAGPSLPPEPQGSDAEKRVVSWVREHGPVSKSDIVDAFEEEWADHGIKGDSWYARHAKPALRESDAEHTRNIGWEFDQ